MFDPGDVADLVLDQRVGRSRVRHAQQRFGQAHQRNTFMRAEAVLLQESVDTAGLAPPRALNQPGSDGRGIVMQGRRGRCLTHPFDDTGMFFLPVSLAEFRAV